MKDDFPLELFSAWIDQGLFGKPYQSMASFLIEKKGNCCLENDFSMQNIKTKFTS